MSWVHALLAAAATTLCACSFPASEASHSGPLPDRESFPSVAQVLVRHCGTLDCHGQSSRNFRLYGSEGLRWAEGVPQLPQCTTSDETEQDYASLVGLEPELLSAVVTEGGDHPERLTLVRKARGAEAHQGGSPFHVGDEGDRCLTSWLRGSSDKLSCLAALPARFAMCLE